MDRVKELKPWKSARFWEDLLERAVLTASQSAISIIGVDGLSARLDLDWKTTGMMIAGATILSILKSLAAGFKGDPESASLVR